MACVFEYKGKQYSQDELVGALKNTPLNEMADFVPGINKVPDAPFKKSWPELAMKRAIRTAVEDGKDRVSWTPGEAQAARYNLSKQVDKIHYNSDLKTVVAYKGGKEVISKSGVKPEDLPDIVGKEAASKIINEPTRKAGNTHELSGQDLKVGGEGMKTFYDQMLPKMVEKLGKKYGVKVKEGNINSTNYDKAYDGLINSGYSPGQAEDMISQVMHKEGGGNQKVHYFDIPEKMKQDVLRKGFPLFSSPLPIPNQRND